ncbi:MAG: hypothetical protein LUC50_01585 [Ruminococcus sp.]|nr:hypothetical protein [Ruminococcus sp.]
MYGAATTSLSKEVICTLRAGVSTACLYPRVVEEALYDLALAGVGHVEIFINTHAELRTAFIDTLAKLMRRFDAPFPAYLYE